MDSGTRRSVAIQNDMPRIVSLLLLARPKALWQGSPRFYCPSRQTRCGTQRSHRAAVNTAAKARCRSSVVEFSLGKGEVLSSILSGSTITLPLVAGLTAGV